MPLPLPLDCVEGWVVLVRSQHACVEAIDADDAEGRHATLSRSPVAREASATSDRPNMTVREAADLLGCSPRTVYKLADAGELDGHRAGRGRGRRIIYRASVEAYLLRRANNQTPASAEPARPSARYTTPRPSPRGPGLKHLHL
jgi:excisionase family DNA binding protein